MYYCCYYSQPFVTAVYDVEVLPQCENDKQKSPLKCTVCNRVYNWPRSLRRHIQLECGKQPQFQCVYCQYKFKHKYSLVRHIASAHPGSKVVIGVEWAR